MLISKIAVSIAFCAGSSLAIVSNGAPFIAYVCPPGTNEKPFAYRDAAAIRGHQTNCKYVAKDNTNPPRHGILVNQCPQTLPDTPECTWYAFDQAQDIPANGAPFVFYATKNEADRDATAVRCRQAGCKWVARANKVKKNGTYGILCNMCQESPVGTPGADSYGFGNNPPPAAPAPPPVVKEVTVTKTVIRGDRTLHVVYVGQKAVRTITLARNDVNTVTRYVNHGGRVKTIYIKYIGGKVDSTRTVTLGGPVETNVVTRYITKSGRRVTVYVRQGGDTTRTITLSPEPTGNSDDGDNGGDNGGKGGDDGDDGDNGGDNGGSY
ncbi:hypothetical protein TWF594_008747 [Orbilia oligospora]|nr:hypothetical protein TWF594_008747 [Orbilia oligospora]